MTWPMTWPVRFYLRKSPIPRGKGFITRHVLKPLLPTWPAEFAWYLPGGGHVMLQYSEDLGLSTLLNGGFELDEIKLLQEHAVEGTTAIDVGANVGIFTISLASVVGQAGAVWAFEPHPGTAHRLTQNVLRNHLTNARVFDLALGNSASQVSLHLGRDAAYHSTAFVLPQQVTGRTIAVASDRLDSVWKHNGSPQVSVLKIDVEGAEADVLAGAEALLTTCRPFLLVEANDDRAHGLIDGKLRRLGYVAMQVAGLMPWNFAYVHRSQL